MATDFDDNFAKLIPCNHVAQLLFSQTYLYAKENDTFHLRFMERTDSKPPSTSDEPVESSTEYDTQPDSDTKDPRVQVVQTLGHFVFSFNEARSPEMPRLGWKVGRGSSKFSTSRNVDLLLARPGDNLGKTLANIHMVFRFNRSSGFLMLRGGSRKAPVEFKMDGVWKVLKHDEEQLMYQCATMLRAGVCEYELQYTVEEKNREIYFRQRDKFLFRVYLDPNNQQRAFERLPGDTCVVRGRYLDVGTRGTGTFGWITQGLDTKTGDPVAIKEIRINGSKSRSDATAEVKLGRQFIDKRGLLPILDSSCEHGRLDPCRDLEKFYIYMPHALSDFSTGFWTDPELSLTTKLHWLKEPLEGLCALHAMGIMHRDIRPQNTLILSTVPPRAALCDYGKAIEAHSSTVTTIGPIHTLAPEVWTATAKVPYTAKIDAWAYGYAIAEILGYLAMRSAWHARITPDRHATILAALDAHAGKSPDDEPLVDLVSKLLRWNSEDRWSAERALRHRCWEPIAQEGREAAARADSLYVKRALPSG